MKLFALLALFSGSAANLANSSDIVTLNNGLKMPVVSFGLQVVDDDTAKTQVTEVKGHRHQTHDNNNCSFLLFLHMAGPPKWSAQYFCICASWESEWSR
jgi:hypothetical protein